MYKLIDYIKVDSEFYKWWVDYQNNHFVLRYKKVKKRRNNKYK